MLSKLSAFALLFLIAIGLNSTPSSCCELNDRTMRHIISTLPRMVPQLRDAGITISQAYYIWPRDAALHAKGDVLLEQYGYDAIGKEALEIFCKAWFCLNYDSLIHERRKFLSTTEKHISENPYITEDHKQINLHILNKDLGHNKEQLTKSVGEQNLKQVKLYRDKIKEIWEILD